MLELADFARRVTQGGTQSVGGGGGGGEDSDAVDFGGAVVACFPCDPAAYRQIAAVALRELLGTRSALLGLLGPLWAVWGLLEGPTFTSTPCEARSRHLTDQRTQQTSDQGRNRS